ncbi:signal peptidase II [Agromyces larvae]|uniref:Lipoprotein signal peptidase n=1 Tax=Agromyces larvae TaxID=2929802 RepID=A0ABY4BYY8_9MICO|nr:signal peptidase II [Agromyces larvae]UOE43081.1 signal peptidase II [Agromyces larvae]
MTEQSEPDRKPEPEPEPSRHPGRWTAAAPWIAVAVAIAVIAADQLTKLWAEQSLEPGVRTPLLGDLLGLQLVYNPGAAFSLGTGSTWVFTILAGVGIVVAAWFVRRTRSRAWAICLGLLLGGAITHFLDRLLREPGFGQGHVVDFIAYAHWFIGNVADIAIFGGAVLVVLLVVRGVPLRPANDAGPAKDAGPADNPGHEASDRF